MNTTTAALKARVTVATIRTWCRIGAVAAVKAADRWVIDSVSLARRITIGARRMAKPEEPIGPAILTNIRRARLGYTRYRADRPALAERYVLPGLLQGVAVWREKGLVDEVTVNGRRYHVLSAKAVAIRATL
ncbi:hypothetical protein ACFVT5_41035 [Streptomyces sp. NPDC058001]|uniref:hypothetical protein n=1 Tax=Streptomyces sp. NPDC058001 TaxID=3346300 RepID=UPI0036EAE2D7